MLLAFLILALASILSFVGGYYLQKRFNAPNLKQLEYYKKTFLRKQGWTIKYGNYSLFSLDGGKMWYAGTQEYGGGVVIQGTAEEVFPGLLKFMTGMDALVSHVKQHGELTLTGENASAERELLESAGLVVTETKT